MISGHRERETVEVLVRRMDVVERVRDRPMEKPALVEALDASRSTVDRAVRDLETHGLIAYTDDGYTTSTLGELVAAKFFDLARTVDVGTRLEPFLEWVAADEFDLDLRHLADADLYVPEPNDPYAMVNRHVGVLERTNRHRLVLPLIGLHGMEAIHEAVLAGEVESEAVVTPGVAETLESNPEYAQLYEELSGVDGFEVYVTDREIPYFVGILDGTVQIGVDDDGEPRALVETEAPEAREWAEGFFTEYKRDSTRLR